MSVSGSVAQRFAQFNIDVDSPKAFQHLVKFYHHAQRERTTKLLEGAFIEDPMGLIALLSSMDDLIWIE
jgi:hypothetical protein